MTRDETALALHMNRRRVQLRLSWEEIAERADTTAAHLRRIRKGESGFSEILEARLEEVLGWAPGSIRAILAGGEPTPAAPQPDQPTVELVQTGGSTITVEVPPGLSAEGRRYLIEHAKRVAEQLLEMEESPHTKHSTD